MFRVPVKQMIVWAVLWAGLQGAALAAPRDTITVGGYEFEPFVSDDNGITPDFIALLNVEQQDFHFDFVRIPAQRRYGLMASGKIDLVFFEMPTWGWRDEKVAFHTTRELLSGHEIFIARRDRWDPSVPVQDRLKHRMVLTLGYHYAFAGFNADQKFLKSQYDVSFAETQGKVLRHLVAGDAEIAIVSDLFLQCAMMKDPSLEGAVLTLPDPDQDYSLPILIRDGAPIMPKKLEALLNQLKANGKLQAFFDRKGIGAFLTY